MQFTKFIFLILLFLNVLSAHSQVIVLEGYVFESGNRGYLNQAKITILNNKGGILVTDTIRTNKAGFFKATLPAAGEYRVTAAKDVFFSKDAIITAIANQKAFLQMELDRKPGYLFDVTLAENNEYKDSSGTLMKDAVQGTRIEIFNNTKKKSELVLTDYKLPNFQFTFEQGNHYTVLIRKKGFFNKRLEAYVNVKGCILCFDGLESVRPGVADNLTNHNSMGTLLANIELKRIKINNGLALDNIYYEPSSYNLNKAALKELDKLIPILRDNPHVTVEIGSHTDSRGDDQLNLSLSQQRAQAVVDYLVEKGNLDPARVSAKGYGKTQIANHCKDGVECSEAEHKKNRRTTLAVTNFDENDETNQRSLENILREEDMAKLLKEVQDQDVVEHKSTENDDNTVTLSSAPLKITPQDATPEGAKKSTKILPAEGDVFSSERANAQVKSAKQQAATTAKKETTKILPNNTATTTENTLPTSPVVPPIVTETTKPIKKNEASTSTKNAPPSKIKPTADAALPNQQPTTTVLEEEKLPLKEVTKKIENQRPVTPKIDLKVPPAAPNASEPKKINQAKPKIPVATQETTAKIGSLPQGFTGFSIQVGAATGDLPVSHAIFKQFKEVMVEEKNDGTKAYLVGAFQKYEDAQSYARNNILPFFPNARVVAFKDGNWF
jgi:outer membrane protein OmpA-like peptidoglycan-associated protein